MLAFVNEAQQQVNLASQDEFPQQRHRPFRRIGHHAVSAIGEPFELHEMRRQRSCQIGLAFDRVHRIVFAPDHQGWTPDPVSNLSLSPPGLANQCSATSGRLTARRAMSGSRGMWV